MQKIPLATQTMFAEVLQRALDAEFDVSYDERGRFYQTRSNHKDFWYYRRRTGGGERNVYVGPVDDEALTQRIQRFKDIIKPDFRERRQLVRLLLTAGLPRPDVTSAMVIEALWKAGFFRLRGLIVGTVAFQCYAGMLGVRLSSAQLRTEDADFALDFAIAHKVKDSMPSILEVLHGVDESFRPVPHVSDPARVSRFKSDNGFLVEFLTSNRGSDDYQSRPATMPALGGASAQPLRHLDFLIREPERSLVLYKGGIPVSVPAPERYAVHKVLLSSERKDNPAKARKDIHQAELLIHVLRDERPYELAEAWYEAWQRGPRWREKMTGGLLRLSDQARAALHGAAAQAKFFDEMKINPRDMGLEEDL
jgi:hypothetical protein